ncbi:hypothetical protein [Hyphobacterium sp.]|uniref:hypothetical protein n=1 Tax=Hyphobacterium sp. TaxID=2004662 RepID=UPI003BA8816A
MQRIQNRLWLGYGLVFGGGIILAGALLYDAVSDQILAWPWSLAWYVMALIPSSGIALVFLTAIEERRRAAAEEDE